MLQKVFMQRKYVAKFFKNRCHETAIMHSISAGLHSTPLCMSSQHPDPRSWMLREGKGMKKKLNGRER